MERILKTLLRTGVYEAVSGSGRAPESLYEIRLRTGKPLVVCGKFGSGIVAKDGGLSIASKSRSVFEKTVSARGDNAAQNEAAAKNDGPDMTAAKDKSLTAAQKTLGFEPFIISAEDIEYTLGVASGHSVYAVSDKLVKGYISFCGIRIGVSGEGVTENGRLTAFKNINSLNVRIPHEVKGCAGGAARIVDEGPRNILVISPPGAGKTTLLRELTRLYSERAYCVLLIDERNEIAAVSDGGSLLDAGDFTDIISGAEKRLIYENVIRAMRPEMIVVDELFGRADADSVCDIIRSGVRVMASLHADGLDALRGTEFEKLKDVFDYFLILEKPGGKIAVIKKGDALF
ncbi:MAG: Flp pilus assembly complex ATPase component TadA [Clostridiales bacterium]|nr:Flp pilus assembly complex ATPase component TadA [Clostridiales bacterium]